MSNKTWKTVLVEPTHDMMTAACLASADGAGFKDAYTAMVRASPEPPESAWQDISTAPLKVPVLVTRADEKLPIRAKRYARGWAFFGAPKQEVYWLTGDEVPTHWQPLPKGPEQ